MKKWVVSLSMAALATVAFSQSARACGDHDKETAAKAGEKPNGQTQNAVATNTSNVVTLTGTLSKAGCHMGKAKMSCCSGYVLSVDGGNKYMIAKNANATKLIKAAKKNQVQVTGTLLDKGNEKVVEVDSFKVLTAAAPAKTA